MALAWDPVIEAVLADLSRTDPSAAKTAFRLGRTLLDPFYWTTDVACIKLPTAVEPMTFDQHRYLVEPYQDTARETIFLKGAQLGFSTLAIIRACWFATTFLANGIYCVDEDTEALTRRGWVGQDSLSEDDEILTLDPETYTSRWSRVEEVFRAPWHGPMRYLYGDHFSALTTHNHRWLVKPVKSERARFVETDNLHGQMYRIPRRAPYVGAPETAVFTDDFVEFVGWVITEGSYVSQTPGQTTIVLTQSHRENPVNTERIELLLGRLGLRARGGGPVHTQRVDKTGITKWYTRGEVPALVRSMFPSKELTMEFVLALTQSQLSLLIDTMIDGDGNGDNFFQKSKATADVFGAALALAGHAVSFRLRHREGDLGRAKAVDGGFDTWTVRRNRLPYYESQTLRIDTIEYRGTVWCPRTPDGTFLARRRGSVYWTGNTLPSKIEVSEFTKARINPIIQGSPYLNSRVKDVNSVMQKQFGQKPRGEQGEGVSTLYFSGSQQKTEATAKNADMLVHDEEDKSNPQVIEMYQSRLMGPGRFKWVTRLSTPTIPDFGIDRHWRRSDKRHWHVRCGGCNADFEMSFPGGANPWSNIEPHTLREVTVLGYEPRYKCHKCSRTLTNDDRRNGFWVTYEPEVGKPHGYQISRMAAPWVSALDILTSKAAMVFEFQFWNMDMAQPFAQGSDSFERKTILERCDTADPDRVMAASSQGSYMGVDVGAKFDVVIDEVDQYGTIRTIKMARLDTWDELSRYMDLYNVRTCVIDSMPELHKTAEWAALFPGRVWRVNATDRKEPLPIWNEETRLIMVDRTSILDRSQTELLNERVLPRYDGSEEWEAYLSHHVNSKRTVVFVKGMETQGIIDRYRWVEVGPDHQFHAATYTMLARMSPRTAGAMPQLGLYSTSRAGNWARQANDARQVGAASSDPAVDLFGDRKLPSWRKADNPRIG